ncbi:MAG: hypothetical protein COS92_03895 [Desulfobacterales bacterium CG07_land_8_20_14_0_80_52_14]|nr:MAG: hypothetical protein COS92_03895 [Desulfobacterales bacterium CG07_land_8_20_14_0_80_52_14]
MGKWIAGILAAVIAGLIVWYFTQGPKPLINVESAHGSLGIRNNSNQIIRVQVAYLYRKGGNSTYCYPFPTRAEEGGEDPKLLPNEKSDFPPGKCGTDFNGYNIKIWDSQYSKLIYEIDR